MSFFKKLFQPAAAPADTAAPDTTALPQDSLISLYSQIQGLRLDLSARDEQIARLSAEIERLRTRQASQITEQAALQMYSLMSDVASPAAQLTTQADLIDNQNQPVQARDILAITRRLIRALQRHGLELQGTPGQQTAYNPDLHQIINASANPLPGQTVTIRFAGVAYQGKIIVKAIVDG